MNKPVLKRSQRTTICLAALVALSLSAKTPAQTLARPGWVGSGMTARTWFKHAVLYRIDPRTFAQSSKEPEGLGGTLKGITERLDYIHDLGVDAILLDELASGPGTVDPALGTIDDFDELSLQASRRNLRILLTISHPDPALARYWLTRGVAGFYVPGDPNSPAVAAIRRLLPSFVGQRVLITDADLSSDAAKSPANELQLDTALLKLPTPPATNAAAELRGALEGDQALLRTGSPAMATDAQGLPHSVNRFAPAGSEREAAKMIAVVLLLNRSVPVIYAGQELGVHSGAAAMMPWGKPPVTEPEPTEEAAAPKPAPPPAPFTPSERYVPYVAPVKPVKPAKPAPPDPATAAGQELNPNSVLSFYRQLIQLHHGRNSVRDGDDVLLNYDSSNALVWVRKTANPSLANPPLVVVCNLSAKPLSLPIKADLTNLHLRGSFLRSVLNPESQPVSMDLNPVVLPPYGVYVGELRY
ncbi:alpha-amylase family protein [Granulicella aggregans]|uniref:alpha-amylase family protein n=1 Tax=Granulicella aggregans TaxID=474949 RepID=UPI0021DF6147|nr:alpha-amylase family protein [Granulicella aggregans]